MGWHQHHAIIVTGWDESRMTYAHAYAANIIGMDTTPLTRSSTNGFLTFVVVPDGSKEGWEESDRGNERRARFIEWLKSQAYYDGSCHFKWVAIVYGDESDRRTEVLDSSYHEQLRFDAREYPDA